MKNIALPLQELFGIAITRGLLGAGIAFWVGERMTAAQRRVTGIALTAVGALSTLPVAADVRRRMKIAALTNGSPGSHERYAPNPPPESSMRRTQGSYSGGR